MLVGTLDPSRQRARVTHVVGRGTPTSESSGHLAQNVSRDAFAARADGPAARASFDRPQGLAFDPDGTRLYVADSYNDALKWLDPASRRVTTWLRGLHEPTGLTIAAGVAYVADTNAHRILAIDLDTAAMHELALDGI